MSSLLTDDESSSDSETERPTGLKRSVSPPEQLEEPYRKKFRTCSTLPSPEFSALAPSFRRNPITNRRFPQLASLVPVPPNFLLSLKEKAFTWMNSKITEPLLASGYTPQDKVTEEAADSDRNLTDRNTLSVESQDVDELDTACVDDEKNAVDSYKTVKNFEEGLEMLRGIPERLDENADSSMEEVFRTPPGSPAKNPNLFPTPLRSILSPNRCGSPDRSARVSISSTPKVRVIPHRNDSSKTWKFKDLPLVDCVEYGKSANTGQTTPENEHVVEDPSSVSIDNSENPILEELVEREEPVAFVSRPEGDRMSVQSTSVLQSPIEITTRRRLADFGLTQVSPISSPFLPRHGYSPSLKAVGLPILGHSRLRVDSPNHVRNSFLERNAMDLNDGQMVQKSSNGFIDVPWRDPNPYVRQLTSTDDKAPVRRTIHLPRLMPACLVLSTPEKKPILFEMNNVPYNLDQLLACKKGPYQWMKENLRENGLREDEMEQLLNENGTMGTDSGELDQSETMDEYSREESVENEMRNKDEEVQPTTPLKQIDEISKISQHVINCREEDMQGDEFMQSIDESSEDESAESSEENVEASDGEDQMEIMTSEEVEVSGLDDTIPMAEEVTEMPKQTFSSITFQFNNSSQDNSSEEEDDEEVICEDDEFDEEQESGEEEDDVEKGGDEFEPGCSYSVTEANEVASDIVENSTSGVALDNGEEGSEEESSEGEAEDSFKRAERQVDQFADSLSVQNVAGDDDWSSEEDPSVTGELGMASGNDEADEADDTIVLSDEEEEPGAVEAAHVSAEVDTSEESGAVLPVEIALAGQDVPPVLTVERAVSSPFPVTSASFTPALSMARSASTDSASSASSHVASGDGVAQTVAEVGDILPKRRRGKKAAPVVLSVQTRAMLRARVEQERKEGSKSESADDM